MSSMYSNQLSYASVTDAIISQKQMLCNTFLKKELKFFCVHIIMYYITVTPEVYELEAVIIIYKGIQSSLCPCTVIQVS